MSDQPPPYAEREGLQGQGKINLLDMLDQKTRQKNWYTCTMCTGSENNIQKINLMELNMLKIDTNNILDLKTKDIIEIKYSDSVIKMLNNGNRIKFIQNF